ncbi:MAG TPA: glycoside hydrolase family 2 TIM barrel-domain containing protein, partial [Luteimonas sp.]|nr:glycoside hydrolase family 2 TIM barrel-domain containing protein [Luteimonas sp.]
DGGRLRTSLNEGWRYVDGPQAGAEAPGFDDAAWAGIRLPHTWNAGDAFDKRKPYRRGEGWYRRELLVEPAQCGKRLFAYFEGANQVAEVFLNGHSLGTHVGGYTAFAFELTPHIRCDAANLLAVRVDNRHDLDIPPLDADFTFYGGIYRNAWLIATDPIHIDVLDHASPGIFVDTPRIDGGEAVVRVRGTLVNASAQAREVQVEHRILDPAGNEAARLQSRLRIDAGARRPFTIESAPLPAPQLWSPETPRLYRVETRLLDGDAVLDRVDVRFGMRWFRFDPDQGFILNGRRHSLYGSNRHQDRAGFGNALSDAQHREDMQHVKDTGFNFVRLAHYPQATAVLDATDALGLAVWEEIPVVNLVTTTEAFAEHSETMLVEMIRQHYNHPSIVMWGYMNEVMQFRPKPEPPGYDDWLLALTRRLEARTRAEDPFRTTATAISYTEIDNGSGFQDIPQVLGLNIYFGWYYHDLDTLGPWLDALHARHPTRPIFISEYGADHDERVRARNPVAFDFSAEYQQRFHERSFAQMKERPWLAGTAVWNHFDFGSNGRQDSKFGINQKGLQYYDRSPKDILYYYKAMMLAEPVLHIAAHEWTRRAGSRPEDALHTIAVYGNLAEVELLHNGVSLGKRAPGNATVRFEVPLVHGDNRLLARGERDGQEVEDAVTIAYEDRQPFFSDAGSTVRGIAVNAGGHYDVVDADGIVWEAGRAWAPGSWGHVGGRPVLTHHRIFDSDLDPLWQDNLAGAGEYRFDVPDGEYQLQLGFVEVEHDAPGERVFDVLVNGEPLLRDLDLAASKGRYEAVEYTASVRARDGGGVVVALPARVGESTISTLRLRKR